MLCEMSFKSRTKLILREAEKIITSKHSSENIDELPLFPQIKFETSSYFLSKFEATEEKADAFNRLAEFYNLVSKVSDISANSDYTLSNIGEQYRDILYSPFDDSDNDKDYRPSSSSESDLEEDKKPRKIKSNIGKNLQAKKKVDVLLSPDNKAIRNGEKNTENEVAEDPNGDEITPLVTLNKNVPIDKQKKRNRTEIQKIENQKTKHPLKDKCLGKCKRDCLKLSESDRNKIWDHYWNMNYTNRRKWLSKHVSLIPVKRRIVSAFKHRSESRAFSLPLSDCTDIKVCRLTFLNTLGYTNDSVITELVRAIKRKPCGAMVKENRGIQNKSIDTTVITNHINSFHPYVSHYRRKNAPNRKYLPRELTVHAMYSDFNEKHPNICKVETYRKVLKEMNISMLPPKSDICDDCETLKDTDTEEAIAKLEAHKQKAAKANLQYKKDAEEAASCSGDKRTFSMDLQKVMLLPMMPQCKASFFISRLVVFNETFATLNKNSRNKSYCVLWHEALAGRKAEAIVDSILKVIYEERDVTEFLFWADNCTGQNKNWVLFTSLTNLVNSVTGPNKITIRYLTKGHTHMSADGVHGNIEKQIRRKRTIYDYQELSVLIQSCRKNLDVLQLTEFNLWKNKKRIAKKINDPLKGFVVNELVEVSFTKGSRNLRYKVNFDAEEMELDFLQKKVTLPISPEVLVTRGIAFSKKEQIIKELTPLMPLNRQAFWQNLPESQTSLDLLTSEQTTIEDDVE